MPVFVVGSVNADVALAAAAHRAAAAGALSTEGMGARTAMPDSAAIDAVLNGWPRSGLR